MKKTDIIISPLKLYVNSGTVSEKYSYTKGSGVYSDSIKYAKPTIVPMHYNLSDDTKDYFIKYNDKEHLKEIITSFILDKNKLENLKNKTKKIVKNNYSLNKLQKQFDDIISYYDSIWFLMG